MVNHEIIYAVNERGWSVFTSNDLSWEPHFHQSIEFCYVMDGEVEFIIGNASYNVVNGETVIVMPNQTHSIKTVNSSRLKFIQISPELVNYFYIEHKNLFPKNSKFTVSNASLIDLPTIPIPNIYKVKAIAYLLISYLCEQCTEWTERKSELTIVEDMLVIAETDFASDITLRDIAKRLGYNYAYLSRIFCNAIGMNFSDYMNNHRINHACSLLKTTDKTITEISYEVGYSTIRSFNRNFLKYTNTTPMKYRSSIGA